MFYAPHLLWKAMNGASGVSITTLIEATTMLDEPRQRPPTLKAMALRIDRYLGHYVVSSGDYTHSTPKVAQRFTPNHLIVNMAMV